MRSVRHAVALMWPGLGASGDFRGVDRAAHWLVPLGFLTGLLYAGAYRATWRQFGEVVYALRLIPAAAVWLIDAAFFGTLLYLGAAATARRLCAPNAPLGAPVARESTSASVPALVLAGLLILKLVLLVAIPAGVLGWPGGGDWRSHFNWVYPRPHYRPLILAPLWGRWAMLLVGSIGRVRDDADERWSGFCRSLTTSRVLLWMVPPTVLTAIYCGRHGRWMLGCIISLIVLGVTYLYGVITARRLGGQDRDTILAGSLVAELTFLIAYEAFAWRIYSS